MGLLDRLLRPSPPPAKADDDIDEWWERHHDPRRIAAEAMFGEVLRNPPATSEEAHLLWQEANALVGKRAPSQYAEFLLYGYLEGFQAGTFRR